MSFFLSVTKVRRCYYSMAREVLEPAPSLNAKKWYFVSDIFLLIYSFRLLYAMYLWQYDFKHTYFDLRYDLVTYYFALHKDSYDSYYMAVVWLFEIFNFYCQFSFYFLDNQTMAWVWWHELIVVNQDEYKRCLLNKNKLDSVLTGKLGALSNNFIRNHPRIALFVPTKILNIYFRLKAKIKIFLTLENIDQKRFFQKPLKVIPLLSRNVRSYALFYCIVMDKLLHFLQIGYCKYFVISTLYTLNNTHENRSIAVVIAYAFIGLVVITYDASVHPWYSIGYAFFEVQFALYGLLQMIQSAIFFVNCTLLGTIVYGGHVMDVNREVKSLVNKSIIDSKLMLSKVHPLLYRQLNEHNRVCYLVIRGCTELFGNVLLCFLLIHLPTNVYLLQQNVFSAPPIASLIILWLIIFFQALAAFVVFAPLAWASKIFHSPKKFLPKLQVLMNGKWWLLYKLKYDDLLNRLLYGPKMALTIGTLQPITFYTALEVCCKIKLLFFKINYKQHILIFFVFNFSFYFSTLLMC